MSTPLTDVYEAFLGRIDDQFYSTIEENYGKQDLLGLLKMAIPQFLYPKIDLTIDETNGVFVNTITNNEIQVLAIVMKYEWLKRGINTMDNIRQKYDEKDFQVASQANHLRALILLQTTTKDEMKTAFVNYSKVKDNKPDFEGLAGGNSE